MSHWRPDIIDNDGVASAFMVPGRPEVYLVHLDVDDCQADTAFMLVDLSDTTNWPHSNTGHVHVAGVDIWFNPDTSFTGDIQFGFLDNVDADNGDLRVIYCWHFENDRDTLADHLNWAWNQFNCTLATWHGPTVADNALFQTDVNLATPDGADDAPSGDGDLVLRVVRTAGTIDISIAVHYEAHA